jgi:hypothetical protein
VAPGRRALSHDLRGFVDLEPRLLQVLDHPTGEDLARALGCHFGGSERQRLQGTIGLAPARQSWDERGTAEEREAAQLAAVRLPCVYAPGPEPG